jgi:hypothetical protein
VVGWAGRNNEFVGSSKRFSQLLMDRGFRREGSSRQGGFIGIKVADDEDDQRPRPPFRSEDEEDFRV